MYWYEVYELLQQGGAIRRSCWGAEEWIELNDKKEIINQNGEFYELCNFELEAIDWEEVVPSRICIDKLDDKHFLAYVQTKSLSIIQNKTRLLNTKMRLFAEKQNAVPEWTYSSGLKYYITYSYVGGKYMIEGTWKQFHPGLVYFSRKEVADKCVMVYKPLLDELRHLEGIRGILFNDKELTRSGISEYNKILDSL